MKEKSLYGPSIVFLNSGKMRNKPILEARMELRTEDIFLRKNTNNQVNRLLYSSRTEKRTNGIDKDYDGRQKRNDRVHHCHGNGSIL